MEFFKDIIYINKMALKKVSDLFMKNWLIIFTGLIYTTINLIAAIIIGPFRSIPLIGLIAGILLYFVSVALFSSYFYVLFNIIKYEKFEFSDIKRGFKVYFYELTRVFFIGAIASFIVFGTIVPILSSSLGGYLSPFALTNILMILVFIALNPLPEVIYLKGRSGLDSVRYSFEYMKENWVEWLIPNIVLLGLIYVTTGTLVTQLFSTGINLSFNVFSIKGIALYLVGQTIFSFTMIYRGVLMEILSTSTRRKRMFMRNTYK